MPRTERLLIAQNEIAALTSAFGHAVVTAQGDLHDLGTVV